MTQTMLPKTLYKLGKVAASYDVEKSSRYSIDGDDWIPPLLGLSNDPKVEEKVKTASAGQAVEGGDESEAEDDDDEEDDDDSDGSSTLADDSDIDSGGSKHALSASSSRALHNLVSQLKTVTSRLSALEQQAPNAANKKWYSSFIPGGTDQGLLIGGGGGSNVVLLTTIGGAAGAALAMSLMRAWEKRRS